MRKVNNILNSDKGRVLLAASPKFKFEKVEEFISKRTIADSVLYVVRIPKIKRFETHSPDIARDYKERKLKLL